MEAKEYMVTITAESIKPQKHGKSDFFSWQLYRWVKKFPTRLTIWSATWSSTAGFDSDNRTLYIGSKRDGTWIHCANLSNLCVRDRRIEGWAFGNAHDTENWEDVTEQFWNKYMQIGVCAIHGDSAHDFVTDGLTRTCKYCSKKERQIVELVERKRWIATL